MPETVHSGRTSARPEPPDRRRAQRPENASERGAMTGAYHVPMGQPADETLSPNPHYYVIQGRAAEIARTLGCPIGGAEHLFLGMLHDGGWPVSVISHIVDLD